MSGSGMRDLAPVGSDSMQASAADDTIVPSLDAHTRTLVRLAGAVTGLGEVAMRRACTDAARDGDPEEVEEILLQCYLFAGFPRTLNAMREWRRISGRTAPTTDPDSDPARLADWTARGRQTCETVYGPVFEALRRNVEALHPALESWMLVDGYGKVLGRPGISLARRELCVVAACAVAGQDRQLHAHLHGAMNAGATREEISATLDAIADLLGPERADACGRLWRKVQAQ